MSDFRLLMIGAMYENGGNTTHRFLDGHPELFVYPFESQVGTRHVMDGLSAMFPLKYRWPEFQLDATPAQDYHAIIDEEGKVRSRTPHVSKFRDHPFDMDDDERRDIYVSIVEQTGRSRANNMAAFFQATHRAWKDNRQTGEEKMYVGYSPIITVDALRILDDLSEGHVLHVVRNPWSAYADTKKRPVPLSLAEYMLRWTYNQHCALTARRLHPDRVHIVRTEDVMADPVATLGTLCEQLGLLVDDSLAYPSWNGAELEQVYPWGTIRSATPAANHATALELSGEEQEAVRTLAWEHLDVFGYGEFLAQGAVAEAAYA
jgi:Sulfotransferase family